MTALVWSRLATALVAALLMPLAAQAGPDVPPAQFTDPQRRASLIQALPRIESLMLERMKDLRMPGLSYALVVDGEVLLSRALGLRDVARGAAVEPETVFRIASMSKSFTALAILLLREDGKLSLDDPVARHVPELRGWLRPTGDAGPITLRHLLSHTAGLPEDNPQGDRVLDIAPEALSAWLAAGVPFSTSPGSEFEYSNLGFILLGRVVRNVSGRPYQDFIRDRILRPLRMDATTYDPAAVPASRLALGHRPDGEGWAVEPLLPDGEGGAMGGLLTTSGDVARYVSMMLAAWPARDDVDAGPAPRRVLREMQSGLGHPMLNVSRRFPGGASTASAASYGHGLVALQTCQFGRVVTHSGGLPGFGSDMRWLPDHGVGIVVLANATYARAGALTSEALMQLKASGALQPRQAAASPALRTMAREAALLVDHWSDVRAQNLAAPNLFQDESAAERRQAMAQAREGLGACSPGRLTAENALRGNQRLDCERGWVDIRLTLAPTQPPRVQELSLRAARPLQPAMQRVADEVERALSRGIQELRLSPKAVRASVAAVLEAHRVSHGTCKLGDVLEGDGEQRAVVRLACDRGTAEATLTLDGGRLAALSLAPSHDEQCLP